jgi:anti-sigma factor RsiW
MCPDDKLLSAFFDGEVLSPWRERMASHIERCPICFAKIVRMQATTSSLHTLDTHYEEIALAETKARILSRLESSAKGRSPAPASILFPIGRLLKQRVELPIPILAATVAALIIVSGIAIGIFHFSGSYSTLASMKKYLENQTSSQALMINLPNGANYSGQNEPVLMIQANSTDASPLMNGNGGAAR